jgi:hypothetical protein
MANLITLQEFKDAKGITITTYDTLINALIPLVSNYIENYCHRSFTTNTFTEKRRGITDELGRYMFHVKNTPINFITSVTLKFFGTTQELSVDTTRLDIFEEAGYALYSYILDPRISVIRPEYQNDYYYTIVYVGGDAEVPGGVKLATITAVSDVLDYYYGSPSASGTGSVGASHKNFKIGDYSEKTVAGVMSTFGSMHNATTGVILTRTVKDLLAPYVSHDQGW